MYEDASDLRWLQELLDRSHAGASEHLRSIVRDDCRPSAAAMVQRLQGMRLLALSTVSAHGHPRVTAVDGHLLHGRWVFTTSQDSVKAVDLGQRPAVSAAYLEGEEFAVFTHGKAEFLGADHPDRGWVDAHLTRHYGNSPTSWGPAIAFIRINPSWVVAYEAHEQPEPTSAD